MISPIVTIVFFIFMSVAMLIYFSGPFIVNATIKINQERAKRFASQMDRTMLLEDIRIVEMFYLAGPFILGMIGLLFVPDKSLRLPGLALGAVIGFIIPKTMANYLIAKRQKQFGNQLIDALLIMSSSFRGGLSLIQALEAIVDEMPNPIKNEFSIVLGENKIGMNIDEAFNRLLKRMPSMALQQVVSAILLARETGGNLPVIFSRIVYTIREKKKLEDSLAVLTVQGKLQAAVMSLLPVGFYLVVNGMNPHYFHVFFDNDLGRVLGITCIVMWLIGTFMILKISSYKDF
ncbi:MAG: type II secretion system F family protein [Candidatus Omnitrophica bacterium]|nr:type II secretion system F family protein [Candidatus Omnitrophota bacterium]